MKFFSIFSARRSTDSKPRLSANPRELDAEEAARLFGLPPQDLTPPVLAALAAMTGEINDLRENVSALKAALSEAESMADHDPLVPLYNRRAFMRELSRLLAFSRRYGLDASVIFFDLDGFKDVNDQFGHAVGDQLLCAVADALVSNTRESDLVGRIGGDEFAAVLTGLSQTAAKLKAQQLVDRINEIELPVNNLQIGITASFGLTPFKSEHSAEHHVSLADEAMYADKLRRKAAQTDKAS